MSPQKFKETLEKLRRAPAKEKVLLLVLAGCTDVEIASETGTKLGTVRKQISNLYKDFGIEGEFEGDRRRRRDELVARFAKYKPDWVSECSFAITDKVPGAATAKAEETTRTTDILDEGEGAIAKPYRELGQAIESSANVLNADQLVLDSSQINHPVSDKKENVLEHSNYLGVKLTEECFAKAINQLESEDIELRLEGIRILEIIANNSPATPWENNDFLTDHWRSMEILTDFIRANAYQKEEEEGEEKSLSLRSDIQEALTVIGRRDRRKDPRIIMLDLSNLDITRANLREANLQGADLSETNLSKANLKGANLQGAYLIGANLRGANLCRTNLKGAKLTTANLERAFLTKANLEEAWLNRANLQWALLIKANLKEAQIAGSNFCGADLYRAINLESHQLILTNGDRITASSLPDNVEAPKAWTHIK